MYDTMINLKLAELRSLGNVLDDVHRGNGWVIELAGAPGLGKSRDVAAIAWGVTLASRANFLLLVPLAFGYLRQHAGWRAAIRAMSLTCATAACLTVPFWLHDRGDFGPLEAASRLLVFRLPVNTVVVLKSLLLD